MNKIFYLFIFFAVCCAQASAPDIISVRDYHSMLTARAGHDSLQLYSDEMAADPEACGIIRIETSQGYSYTMIAGMEDQPMKELSQSRQDYYFHWVEQGSLQGEEELTSPLMMFEEGKEDPEQAKKKIALEQQQQERNRQATDEEESDSSSSEQRSQKAAAIKEGVGSHQPPREIRITTPPDDISEMTGDYTTLDNSNHHHRSPVFSRKGAASNALLQAQDKLRLAREEVFAASRHFDFSQSQWEAFKNLESASKNHYEFQQQLSSTYADWGNAAASLQQAQAAAHEAWSRNDPSYTELNQAVEAAGKEVHRTFQEYQALIFPAQSACQNYYFAQQRGSQQGLMTGVDYTSVFNEAQLRANRAAEELDKCQEAARKIKLEKPSLPKKKETGALSQKTTAPVGSQQRTAAVIKEASAHLEQLVEASISQQAEAISKSSATDAEKIFHEDKGTQISEEDLAVWEHEAFLKKQSCWKKTFHQMVMQVQQVKEAVAANFSKQLLHEVSQEFSSNVAQASLVEKQQAERKLLLEKKERIFRQLFVSEKEMTEPEKSEQQQERAASMRALQEAERAEMEQFCTERVNLLRQAEEEQQPEVKNLADTVAPLIQRAGDILTQCYRRPYEWCSDTMQLMQDWRTVQVEAGKVTAKFFADQGLRITDVPTAEYAWKSGQVAQELYNEIVAKRRLEETALKRNKDPREELGYFEQMPILLEGPVFKRFVTNFFTSNFRDSNRESDERAANYFTEIGKPDPRIFEFWKKSAEIEEQLKKERLEKAKEFAEQFPDQEEMLRAAQKWGNEWRERLQQERQQKEATRLEQVRLAEEEKRQRIVQAVIDQRAAQEAEQQKVEKELLDQEAKGKEQRQNTKKKNSKKK